MTIRRVHGLVGLTAFLCFVGTGVYMRLQFPELYGGNETVRMLYRSNHIYLLMSGLANMALGASMAPAGPRWRRHLQRIGSLMVLAAPAVLLYAFFREPPLAVDARPATHAGVMGLTAGVIAYWFASRRGDAAPPP
jgi:hypothetical protein